MKMLFNLFLALFALKMLWNASIPFLLEARWRRVQENGSAKPVGVSMALELDILLLLLLCAAESLGDAQRWPFYLVLVSGIGCILSTYVVGGALAALVRKRS